MKEIIKHINDTNASYRDINAGDAKNTDLFLDQEHKDFFAGLSSVKVRLKKDNLSQAILFISSILPRKYDRSGEHYMINYSSDFVFDNLQKIEGFFQGNSTKIVEWTIRTDIPKKNGEIDGRFYLNNLIEDYSYIDKTGVTKKSKFTIRDFLAGGYSDIHFCKESDSEIYDLYISNTTKCEIDKDENEMNIVEDNHLTKYNDSLQQIIYGAPGTGKSHKIKTNIANAPHYRTTFHPDSDYSSFVGAYKPTTIEIPVTTCIGTQAVPVINANGTPMIEKKIIYNFVAQSFLNAYIEAWKNFPQKQYLIIEEINRGNCAQIFGDLFQLLDRNGAGFSDYPIQADNDICQYIHSHLSENELSETDKDKINTIYADEYDDVVKKILDGEVLLLPSNLSILATMNTSDQSLFPIDSAFKRRWDWKYIPISNAGLDWIISVNGYDYDWWSFLEKINDKIGSTTDSEDKKLGYFFVKAESKKSISSDRFVGKVIFYLWNDVFKDYGFDDEIFKDGDDVLTFQKFFNPDGTANEEKIQLFLENMGVEKKEKDDTTTENNDSNSEEDDKEFSSSSDARYSINGKGEFPKRQLATEIIKLFVNQNSEMTASDVIEKWKPLSKVTHFVENQEEHNKRTEDGKKRTQYVTCGDGSIVWISTDGWVTEKIEALIKEIDSKDWNIHISKL